MNNYWLWRSYSRSTLMWYCQRKFFFNHYVNYLSKIDKSFRLKWLLLKNLKSLDMRVGELMHNLISDYLRLCADSKDTATNIEIIKNNLIDHARIIYNQSKKKDYSQYDRDKRFWLSEHYYKLDIDNRFEDGLQNIFRWFDWFISSNLNQTIKTYFQPSNKRFIEEKELNFDKMKIVVEGIPELIWVTLRAKPDFGVKISDNYLIYDWKTGKEEFKEFNEVSDQLKVYAYKLLINLWIDKFHKIKIEWYEIFLGSLWRYGGQIGWEDIEYIEKKIISDVEVMKSFIVDWDIENNIPISLDVFKRTENQNKCISCTFRDLCSELKNYEDRLVK